MPVEGIWNLFISTPIGRMKAVVELRGQDAVLTGVARGADEEVPLSDIALDGDTLVGTSRVGRLPASKVTGERRTAPERRA
ncbi:hypothetical protein [Streptomyces sp. NPDC018947]|uniref:hypothetical protein n=1 Tax=Streptomyces sp. NPDC018947 TaxID=3365054 RepID=UPI0037B3F971